MHDAAGSPLENTLAVLVLEHVLVEQLHLVRRVPGHDPRVLQGQPLAGRQASHLRLDGITATASTHRDRCVVLLKHGLQVLPVVDRSGQGREMTRDFPANLSARQQLFQLAGQLTCGVGGLFPWAA